MRQLPTLQEFTFPSRIPLIGPLISLTRRVLYGVTAKWGVWAVIQQQNQINQIIEERLYAQEERLRVQEERLRVQEERLQKKGELLVDIDRDFAHLAKIVAEIQVRQRNLAKILDTSRDSSQDL